MTPALSPNTQAILLLTAPLLAGRGTSTPDLLTPGEYKRLARRLREIQRQPADLVSPDAGELLRACQHVIDDSRLQRLLGRGFLLSQVVDRWQTRAIWVVSRADAAYPRRLKARLREDAPAVLYGCGQLGLLETGGLAVVGSRHVDDALINYTLSVGHLAARAGRTLISGGAKGIDLAAMRGALEAGGKACGVLADSLEKTSLNREHRNLLLEGHLTLISPYDPSAGFNVGHAMQRNKLIYALADASLVVNSDVDKGGTWAGAIEQLEKLRFIPVYVRSTGKPSAGLDALRQKGALAWPNPQGVEMLETVFSEAPSVPTPALSSMLTNDELVDSQQPALTSPEPDATQEESAAKGAREDESGQQAVLEEKPFNTPMTSTVPVMEETPADSLFSAVRESILRLLTTPMKDTEVAAGLEVLTPQARTWLQRLVDEGVLEKQKKPATYVVTRKQLFG